jgi:amidohydrolase
VEPVQRNYKERALEEFEVFCPQIIEISQAIHSRPELGSQEYFALELLTTILARHGFKVIKGLAGLPTAFFAEYRGMGEGPRIALLAEYDALPELGHACGHNLIGAASVGAGLVLRRLLDELPGSVVVIGTPAEETNGAKVTLVETGIFDNIDIALMFHPGDCYAAEISSLAMDALEFVFTGKAAHAAACPQEGINALDAVLSFFGGINALRQQLNREVSIHGIITEGGISPNIIPERTTARFYIRAQHQAILEPVVEKVKQCARGAALMTGTSVEWRNFEYSYKGMLSNPTLASLCRDNLYNLGVKDLVSHRETKGSLDMGNVSQVVPSLHPYLRLQSNLVPHSRQFAEAAGSQAGAEVLSLAVKLLAWMALDIFLNPFLAEKAKNELRNKLSAHMGNSPWLGIASS